MERTLLDDPRVGVIAADELRQRLGGLPDDVAEPLVAAQLASKLAALRAQHPDAVVDLVSSDGSPVAYLVVDEVDAVIRLCDIAVVPTARGRGFGRALLARLLDRADADEEAIELSVWHDAIARGWYERHGFRTVGGDRNGHVEMRREPAGE
jgi:ribosomal protein S18 acetylase RimI-like enzyme